MSVSSKGTWPVKSSQATTKMQTGAFLTATGTTVGTPTYMAPEQAMAQDIGPWTDLYSVGCMAFELFTGRVPFHDSDAPMAILLRHVNEPIPAVKSIDPSVDQGVSDWIERLLVKEPAKRTQSANDAWDEFEELIINLLGPRWRREARLVLDGEPPRALRTLTPASFHSVTIDTPEPEADEAPGGRSSRGRDAVPQTISGPSVGPPPPTVAPSRRRQRNNTTMFRLARRHRDVGDDEGPLTPDVMRRRVIAAVIVVAMVGAAVVGVVLATSSHKAAHHGPTPAQIRAEKLRATEARQKAEATANANKQINTILTGLALTRNRNVIRLANETTPTKQIRDATTIQKAYVAAVHRITPLQSKTAAAAPLVKTLGTIALDYGRLIAAARTNKPAAFSRAYQTIMRDDHALQREIPAV